MGDKMTYRAFWTYLGRLCRLSARAAKGRDCGSLIQADSRDSKGRSSARRAGGFLCQYNRGRGPESSWSDSDVQAGNCLPADGKVESLHGIQ